MPANLSSIPGSHTGRGSSDSCRVCSHLHGRAWYANAYTHTNGTRPCVYGDQKKKKPNKAEALHQPFQKIREHARFSTQMQLVYFDLSSSKLLTPQLKYAVCSNKYQAVVMTDQPICASRMYNFCL